MTLKQKLHEIIFEADTRPGKIFDVLLIISILLSVGVVLLESVNEIREAHGELFTLAEWFFTALFTVEYILRLYCVGSPGKYARSFYGMVDLLSIIPTYLSLIIPGSQYLLVIRILRVLRIFRVLKFVQYVREANVLMASLIASRRKITIFFFFVLTLVVIIGATMYVIEGEESGFTSIPKGIYWAVVTMTTVGYGDISPQTSVGQFFASFVMILGCSILAVPTGIVTAELSQHVSMRSMNTQACPNCSAEGHDNDAVHCKYCGEKL